MSGHDDKAEGFGEQAVPYDAPPEQEFRVPVTFKVTVGPGGRIVIPAEVRKVLGIEEGTVLVTRLDEDEWRVTTVAVAVRRVQAIAAKYKRPGVSEVDEFLAQRRAMWGEE